MAFPPAKSNSNAPADPPQVDSTKGVVSTGGGGISKSLKIKAAGTKDVGGPDGTVGISVSP